MDETLIVTVVHNNRHT